MKKVLIIARNGDGQMETKPAKCIKRLHHDVVVLEDGTTVSSGGEAVDPDGNKLDVELKYFSIRSKRLAGRAFAVGDVYIPLQFVEWTPHDDTEDD